MAENQDERREASRAQRIMRWLVVFMVVIFIAVGAFGFYALYTNWGTLSARQAAGVLVVLGSLVALAIPTVLFVRERWPEWRR